MVTFCLLLIAILHDFANLLDQIMSGYLTPLLLNRQIDGLGLFNPLYGRCHSPSEYNTSWAVLMLIYQTRYNFYLDEIIAICNRFIVAELHCAGHQPHLVPVEVLQGDA